MEILRSAPVQVYIFAQMLENLLGRLSVLAYRSEEALFLSVGKVPEIRNYVCSCSLNNNGERKKKVKRSLLYSL